MNRDYSLKYRLQEAFTYKNGKLFWRKPDKYHTRLTGKEAGVDDGNGYTIMQFEGKHWRRHRLVWIYHYGYPDKGKVVDHKNRDKTDDRIENLRLLTQPENMKNNTKVSVRKIHNRYQARRAQRSLGVFDTRAQAVEACMREKVREGIYI